MTTYNRKYYLIRKLKADGWKLLLKDGERTIVIPADKVKEADDNEIISELMYGYGFGAQIQRSIPEPPINRALDGHWGLNLNFPNPPLICNQGSYSNTSGHNNVAIGTKTLNKEDIHPKRLPFFKRLLNKLYAR